MKKTFFKSRIIWLTGLSGSGKTTIAKKLQKKLKIKNFRIKRVDGDTFRKKTKNLKNFSKKNIIQNNNLIINHIKIIYKNYDYIIVSVISPLKITRLRAKNIFGKNYFEVLVWCGIRELIKRDTKGLYKLAIEKKKDNLIGYKSKISYEKSKYRVISVDTKKLNLSTSVNKILKNIT